MRLTVGKLLVILVLLYILLATPWYIPKVVEPLVFGIPLWAIITVIIILILGYVLVYTTALSIERRIEHG